MSYRYACILYSSWFFRYNYVCFYFSTYILPCQERQSRSQPGDYTSDFAPGAWTLVSLISWAHGCRAGWVCGYGFHPSSVWIMSPSFELARTKWESDPWTTGAPEWNGTFLPDPSSASSFILQHRHVVPSDSRESRWKFPPQSHSLSASSAQSWFLWTPFIFLLCPQPTTSFVSCRLPPKHVVNAWEF